MLLIFDEIAPATTISVGNIEAPVSTLFCIINFVSGLISSYKCNLLVGLNVPIPTFEVL